MAIITPWMIAVMLFNVEDVVELSSDLQLEQELAASGSEFYSKINYKKRDTVSKADHSQFIELQQDFKTPQDVTLACLRCHNKTAQDVMMHSHWNWTRDVVTERGDTVEFGKKNSINNFCQGVASNEARCTSCHIGYGWTNQGFDFNKKENIDCLVCHDQTKTYKKFPTKAGYPVTEETVFEKVTYLPPDYKLIAQHVGAPTRENCGACHYFGGGGNNVKHGDLEMALSNTTKKVDVHMGKDGGDMTCTECHAAEHHNVSGQLYSVSSDDENNITCTKCHAEKPHQNKQLNLHSNKVACQTCHIPVYAKVNPTKLAWDWEQAGKFKADGSVLVEKDSAGNVVYTTQKGRFIWGKNVEPEYVWFNGNAKHYITGDKIDTNSVVGSYEDPKSKIIPVKLHKARQIYDTEHNILINPHLFGKDSTAYWTNFDWGKAAASGMAAVNQPYSGKYGFVNTVMYWPINHMVSESSEALTCVDCHSHDGRLNSLTGFYLIGRDSNTVLDSIGIFMIIGSLLGVLIHGILRKIKAPVHNHEN